MTTTDLILPITLTVIHWIAAYFICRWDYRTSAGDDRGLGILWIPIIGWFMIWLFVIFGLMTWLGSAKFKAWFYGTRKRKTRAALQDVIRASDPYHIGSSVNRATNALILNDLVTRSFSTHYRIWKKS